MSFFLFKLLVSALVIALLSELAKRMPVLSGLLTAMPITTLLVLFWLYLEKKEARFLYDFSLSVFWGIFPTLFFFLAVLYGLKKEMPFFLSLGLGFTAWFFAALVHLKFLQR